MTQVTAPQLLSYYIEFSPQKTYQICKHGYKKENALEIM